MTNKPIMLMLVVLFVQQTAIAGFSYGSAPSLLSMIYGVVAHVLAALALAIAWMEWK